MQKGWNWSQNEEKGAYKTKNEGNWHYKKFTSQKSKSALCQREPQSSPVTMHEFLSLRGESIIAKKYL